MITKAIHGDGRGTVRPYLVLVSGVAAIAGITFWAGVAWAQEPQLAREGRGLLPPPAKMPATLQGTRPPHPFVREPWGGFSRTVFETDEDPDFKIIIRDFSFPPDRQTHTVTLAAGAFAHVLSGSAEISVARKRLALGASTAVPANAPIEVMNNGDYPVVVRALIVEAK